MDKCQKIVGGKSSTNNPSIGEFLSGKCIFITGATGFLGTVLIERLLNATPEIGKIFILIRDKNGKSAEERVKRLMSKVVSKFGLYYVCDLHVNRQREKKLRNSEIPNSTIEGRKVDESTSSVLILDSLLHLLSAVKFFECDWECDIAFFCNCDINETKTIYNSIKYNLTEMFPLVLCAVVNNKFDKTKQKIVKVGSFRIS